MDEIGSTKNPLRVAIIGSGPAGFYTVSNFLKNKELVVEFDMYDRLPTPFGLVRAGVAPDHQKDKSVQKAYDKNAQLPNFRFFGNVEYGSDITIEDLRKHYHQVMFSTGAPFDRNLGIPGENLDGCFSATEFVAWYNGHPDFADRKFDLSQENVVIVGVGNVAMDVARMLCKTHKELSVTDVADHALVALKNSKVKNVYILGRRGPAQAAFTPPEIKELGEFEDADVTIPLEEAKVDAASLALIENDKNALKNINFISEYAERTIQGKSRLLTIRFLVSPVEVIGVDGKVKSVKVVKNKLVENQDGTVRPVASEETENIPAGLIFRSVGYKGKPLTDIPYDENSGTILNNSGRVVNSDGVPVCGLYTAGWIKRGPSGVIGTNKTCAQETVARMIEDIGTGKVNIPEDPSIRGVEDLINGIDSAVVTYPEWQNIDRSELQRGEAQGRPRVKYTDVDEMISVAKG
ncbi:MAG: FAD-dependent oxidoreductase [Pseudomonadota bacterium]|nr:FAD-dependent oxidoreductase [Pseudomonadota bacterium]